MGSRSVPATVINGKAVYGFSPNEVTRLLGLDIHVEPSQSVPQFMTLIDRLLVSGAACMRQLSDQYMTTATLDGSRTMGKLAPHIFQTVDAIMTRIDTLEMPDQGNLGQSSWSSFREIADYADKVLVRWRDWAPKQKVGALKVIPAEGSVAWHYSSARSGYEFLDYIGNHTTHHMRQFYWNLDKLGIAPKVRIPDSELPAEYIQTIVVLEGESRLLDREAPAQQVRGAGRN